MDPLDAEPLEPLDGADDVDEGIHRAHLVQRHLLRRHAVHAAFGLAQQPERADGALAHPLGDRGLLHRRDQLTDVSVRPVIVNRMLVMVATVIIVVVHGR